MLQKIFPNLYVEFAFQVIAELYFFFFFLDTKVFSSTVPTGLGGIFLLLFIRATISHPRTLINHYLKKRKVLLDPEAKLCLEKLLHAYAAGNDEFHHEVKETYAILKFGLIFLSWVTVLFLSRRLGLSSWTSGLSLGAFFVLFKLAVLRKPETGRLLLPIRASFWAKLQAIADGKTTRKEPSNDFFTSRALPKTFELSTTKRLVTAMAALSLAGFVTVLFSKFFVRADLLVTSLVILFVGMLGMCSLFGFIKLLDRQPGLVLDAQGIWINTFLPAFGLVPWDQINSFVVVPGTSMSPAYVRLLLKDRQQLLEDNQQVGPWKTWHRLAAFDASGVKVLSQFLACNVQDLERELRLRLPEGE